MRLVPPGRSGGERNIGLVDKEGEGRNHPIRGKARALGPTDKGDWTEVSGKRINKNSRIKDGQDPGPPSRQQFRPGPLNKDDNNTVDRLNTRIGCDSGDK